MMDETIIRESFYYYKKIIRSYENKQNYCLLCPSFSDVKLASSHALQEAAIRKIHERANIKSPDEENITVYYLDPFASNSVKLHYDNTLKDPEKQTLLKSSLTASTFKNICFNCEKSSRYETMINKDKNYSFNKDDKKHIMLRAFLSLKYDVDREIYFLEAKNNDIKNGNLNKLNKTYFSKDLEILEKYNNYSKALHSLILDIALEKKAAIVLYDSFNDNINININFGCLTARMLKIDKSTFSPAVIYISPYGVNKTRIMLLSTDSNIKTDDSMNIKKLDHTSFFNIYSLLNLHSLNGCVFDQNNKGIIKLLKLRSKIRGSMSLFDDKIIIDDNKKRSVLKLLRYDKNKPLLYPYHN